MDNNKEYFAFISYKREDEKWAVWLQNKLEHYKLPSNMNGRTDLPKEIRPIFRDKTDLTGGFLSAKIQNALEASKYLIVICSPRAAQSQWVGKEVKSFIDMGRTDKIIPFIIGGTAHAQSPEDECFPSALLNLPPEQELLGINIDEMGRDAAAVKVVAQMFGLKFDTLWQRYEREQRRRRIAIIAVALLLALIGVGTAVYIFSLNKVLSEKNKRITTQSDDIQIKNNRLLDDSAIMAAQLDSISKRDVLIELQRDSIAQTNKYLIVERDNLAKANWEMMASQSRFLSETALQLASEGDIASAFRICLEILPKNINKPERPYVPEAEYAFRQIYAKDRLSNERVFLKKVDDNYSWKIIRKISTGVESLYSVVFSPDNRKIVTTSESGLLRVFDVETNKCVYSDFINYFETGYAEFSPNGRYIGTTGWGSIYLIDLETHNKYELCKEDEEELCMACGKGYLHFSNDGRFLVTSLTGQGIRVFDISNSQSIEEIELSCDGLEFLISNNNSELLVKDIDYYNSGSHINGYQSRFTIFDIISGRLLGTIGCAFSKDSYASYDITDTLIRVVDNNKVFVIDRKSLSCIDTIMDSFNDEGPYYRSVNDVVYYNNKEGNIGLVIDRKTLICIDTIKEPFNDEDFFGNNVVNVIYNKDGATKAEIKDGKVLIYMRVGVQDYSIDSTSMLRISPNESLIATVPVNSNSVLLWDANSQRLLFQLIGQSNSGCSCPSNSRQSRACRHRSRCYRRRC